MHISIDHRKIHYQWINRNSQTEKKPVIIFLHDGLGSIAQWKDFPELVCQSTGLQGLIYEREGYGQSSFWEGNIPEDYLEIEGQIVLPNILSRLNIKNYFLFGHSDGGTLNLYHASINPEGLIGMVVEAPHVIIEDKTVFALDKVINPEDPTFLSRLDKYHYGRASKLICLWTSYWMRPKFENWNMIETLKSINTPTLLVQGDMDEFGSFEQLETIKKYSQSTTIEELRLANCGHIPHHQQRDLVLKGTIEFIGRLL
jgi:pimeloyl-ACP methyl ester carboxylesterase